MLLRAPSDGGNWRGIYPWQVVYCIRLCARVSKFKVVLRMLCCTLDRCIVVVVVTNGNILLLQLSMQAIMEQEGNGPHGPAATNFRPSQERLWSECLPQLTPTFLGKGAMSLPFVCEQWNCVSPAFSGFPERQITLRLLMTQRNSPKLRCPT